MNKIKQFIDKIAGAKARGMTQLVFSLTEAEELRDEITKLLLDKNLNNNDHIEVVVNGGKW